MRFAETVQTTVLPNGLTVITDHFPRDKQDPYRNIMAARIICRKGSNDDPDDLNGRAHFSEHMIANASGRFKTVDGWRQYCNGLCLQEYQLQTGREYTQYLATGEAGPVGQYLNLIADGINGLHHTDMFMEHQRGRIVNEMEGYLTTFGEICTHTFLQAAFAGQSISRWDGGYPRHLERATIDDILTHHRDLHTGHNMVLMTSGAWTHQQACDWATKNLGTLPPGQRQERLARIFTTGQKVLEHPYLYHPEAGFMVEYQLAYDAGFLSPPEREAMGLGCLILGRKINETFPYYGISIKSADCHNHQIINITGSKLREDRLRQTLHWVVDRMRDAIDTISFSELITTNQQITTVNEQEWKQQQRNPIARINKMASWYLREDDPTYFDFISDYNPTIGLHDAMTALRRVLSRVPLTMYIAAREGDFPRGRELQDVWFGKVPPKPQNDAPHP